MSGLDDLDPSSPAGDSLLSLGDDAIRLVITKLIEAYTLEHAGSGQHALMVGTIAQRPAPSGSGRLYILTVASVAAELQFDTGSAWSTLTQNQTIIDYASALSTHINQAVINHPDNSVTSAKIKAGQILKRHLMGGVSTDSIALLVNGGDANPLHTHTLEAQAGQNGVTIYTVAGSHILTVPQGVVRMFFTMIGGGAAGGAGQSIRAGAGGASGTVVWNYPLTVIPSEELALYVGVGGQSNNISGSRGGPGQATTVERVPYDAHGGQGGCGGYCYDDDFVQGTGGVPRQGMIQSYGGGRGGYDPSSGTSTLGVPGESSAWFDGGDPGATAKGGGGGAASIFGAGKNGGAGSSPGASASDGSGAGGGGGGSWSPTYGGNGGSGRIIVTW